MKVGKYPSAIVGGRSLLSAVFLILTLASVNALVFAQPPSWNNPDITLSGSDFAAISGYYDGEPTDEGQENCIWYPDGGAIFTLWDHGGPVNHFGHCLWVMYIVDLDAGYWRVGLNAINIGAGIKDSQWYPWFEVLVELESTFQSQAGMDSAVVFVPASDEEIEQGFQWFHIPEDGLYGIKYTWLNDKSGEGYDANIKIDSVFFDKWPPGPK
jgi:hypothetical protein